MYRMQQDCRIGVGDRGLDVFTGEVVLWEGENFWLQEQGRPQRVADLAAERLEDGTWRWLRAEQERFWLRRTPTVAICKYGAARRL